MQSVIVIGPRSDRGNEFLAYIDSHRGEYMIDGLVDDGQDSLELASLVLEYTPLRLGVTDEYAVGNYQAARSEMATDAGILGWELPEVEVHVEDQAVNGALEIGADVVVICDPNLLGDADSIDWSPVGRILAWEEIAGVDAEQITDLEKDLPA